MIGGVIGDFIGSVFEDSSIKSFNLTPLISRKSHITDDTVLLCATAEALMTNRDFEFSYRKWAAKYPGIGYGRSTRGWLQTKPGTMGFSYGNGSASRAGVIGFLDIGETEVMKLAKESAECSHGHEEAIHAAQAVALTIHLLKKGHSVDFIEAALYRTFDYIFLYDLVELHENLMFDCSAVTSVPIAIYIALHSENYEKILRICLYVGAVQIRSCALPD